MKNLRMFEVVSIAYALIVSFAMVGIVLKKQLALITLIIVCISWAATQIMVHAYHAIANMNERKRNKMKQ